MTCLIYYPLCLLTETVFYLHFIIHDTTAKKKSLVIFFFSAILRMLLVTVHGQGYEKPIGAMVSSASLFRRHLLRYLLFYITLKVLLQRSAS